MVPDDVGDNVTPHDSGGTRQKLADSVPFPLNTQFMVPVGEKPVTVAEQVVDAPMTTVWVEQLASVVLWAGETMRTTEVPWAALFGSPEYDASSATVPALFVVTVIEQGPESVEHEGDGIEIAGPPV